MVNIFSPSNWSFKIKFFVPCLLATGLMLVLTVQALDDINELKTNLTFVVNNRFDASVILTQSVEHLLIANSSLYRVQTFQAAGIKQNIQAESERITKQLDDAIADLNKFKTDFASMQEKKKIDEIIINIRNYKDAVNFVSSMLEIKFKATVNFLTPLDGVYENAISYLTSLVNQYLEDSKHLKKVGSEEINYSLQKLMLLGMIAVLFIVFVTLYIVVSTDRSIRELAYATQRVSEGDPSFDLSSVKRGDELGQIVSALSVRAQELMREVEMRRELQIQLEKAKEHAEASNKAKSQFLANMSHEIRTPMNAIMGFSDLMMLITELTPQQLDYMRTIMQSSENLLSIINDILDVSKIEAGLLKLELAEYDLKDCIEKALSMLAIKAQEKGLTLTLDYPQGTPRYVVGDQVRMRQVIVNLVSNGIKFADRGDISVSVKSDVNQQGIADFLIKVRDNGIGIPKDKQQHIFEKFTQADNSTTRKYGGTGLGLAISKQLVELMGGTIGVDSALGCGATFWFHVFLNLGREDGVPPVSLLKKAEEQENIIHNCRVLAVEENDMNRKVLADMLESVGCIVTVAKSGGDAMEALKRATFNIVFMDCQMLEMDGFQAIHTIRKHIKDGVIAPVSIIAVTSNTLLDRKKFIEAGMDDFLLKPLKRGAITRMVQKWYAHV